MTRRRRAVAILGFMWGNVALADDAGTLDGTYVTIGPVAAATRVEGEWTSSVGLELSVARVDERRFPAAWGIAGGGVSYASRPGGRLWLEAEGALYRPLPFPVGVAAGVTAEVDATRPPRWGAQGTLWFLAGFVPYARVGAVEESGHFVELGVMLKIPARRFR
jgi:hypothetical protein